jgi:hypothetical protein
MKELKMALAFSENIIKHYGINMNIESNLDLQENYVPLNIEGFHGEDLKTEDVGSFTIEELDAMNPCDCVITVSPELDRFNLEEEILRCWGVTSDLTVLNGAVLDSDISNDDISNILIGIQKLYQLKFEKLWKTFETLIANGTI